MKAFIQEESETIAKKRNTIGRPPGALREEDHELLRAALHGGLGQLLTSISFLAGALQQKLAAQKLPEETQAAEILSLTGRAISETQALVLKSDCSSAENRRLIPVID